jgi:hypothetical protein
LVGAQEGSWEGFRATEEGNAMVGFPVGESWRGVWGVGRREGGDDGRSVRRGAGEVGWGEEGVEPGNWIVGRVVGLVSCNEEGR